MEWKENTVSEYEQLVSEREKLKTVLDQNRHIKHKPSYKAAESRLKIVRDKISKLAKAYQPLR
jgi:hypothetical protein